MASPDSAVSDNKEHARRPSPFESPSKPEPAQGNERRDLDLKEIYSRLISEPTPRNPELTERASDKPEAKWGDKIPGAAQLAPSPYVFAALTEAMKKDIKMDPNWSGDTAAQKQLLKQSASLGPEVKSLVELGLLDAAAQAGGSDKVNDLFARHGIPITLKDVGPDGIATGGVFHFKADWKGSETTLNAKDQKGEEKQFSAFEKGVKSYNVNGQTVIEVYRDDKKGITMYMAATDSDMKGYEPYNKAFELTPGANTPQAEFNKAVFPKMMLRDQGDMPQLIGMRAAGGLQVSEAKLFTSIDIDQNGAEVKQGAGLAMTRSLMVNRDVTYKMDKPPLMWIMQDGASKPLFATRITQEAWKDPKKG